jgi:hypothetical protein
MFVQKVDELLNTVATKTTLPKPEVVGAVHVTVTDVCLLLVVCVTPAPEQTSLLFDGRFENVPTTVFVD